jgi:Glycosyltransferase Family 4
MRTGEDRARHRCVGASSQRRRAYTGGVDHGLTAAGHEAIALPPDLFRTVRCPTDREVRLALGVRPELARRLSALTPEAIHIATEGPLGHAARAYCLRQQLSFTTAYHTKFPEYPRARLGLPAAWSYAALRRFHGKSSAVMVATPSVGRELAARGFERVVTWTRGVDVRLFRPAAGPPAICLGRYSFTSVEWLPKKTCRPSSISICPGRSLWSATGICWRR